MTISGKIQKYRMREIVLAEMTPQVSDGSGTTPCEGVAKVRSGPERAR